MGLPLNFLVVWFVPVHGAAESMHVNIFLMVIDVVLREIPVLKREKVQKGERHLKR